MLGTNVPKMEHYPPMPDVKQIKKISNKFKRNALYGNIAVYDFDFEKFENEPDIIKERVRNEAFKRMKETERNTDMFAICQMALRYLDYVIPTNDKYKLHDLRENPNDLPKEGVRVLCYINGDYYIGEISYPTQYRKHYEWWLDDANYHDNTVLAWKYIELFEEE